MRPAVKIAALAVAGAGVAGLAGLAGLRAVVVTLFFLGAFLATAFVILFGIGTRLRPPTPAGRQILTFASAAAYLLDLAVLSFVTGARPPVWLSIPGYAALDVALAWQIWLLLRRRTTRTEEPPMTAWLRRDALNRAWRTILQGLMAVVILPALDAGLQAVVHAATDGGPIDWRRVAALAITAAVTAATMSIAAYLHRLKLDPSAIPSAQPPRPPGTPASTAPATDATPQGG